MSLWGSKKDNDGEDEVLRVNGEGEAADAPMIHGQGREESPTSATGCWEHTTTTRRTRTATWILMILRYER
jgi:hypothetical protein